jgi:UDP-GlcNAc:undecaprenyl-phosphate GlcNAc-1-phosphate transferase
MMPDGWADYAISFGIALATSLVATAIVRALARRANLVAKPRPDRWHKKPTALFGGVAIFIAFVVSTFTHRAPHVPGSSLLVLCATGVFIIGLVDDLAHLKPYAKLVGQIVFCSAITVFGLRLHWLPSEVLDQALTIFWLVGITNAINLLDNLDGLAGGVSLIAALYLVYFCHAGGHVAIAWMAAAFAGAVLGFLAFNVNPASIFMGDCGSLFLGFFLGAAALVQNSGGARRNVLAVLVVPVLVLMIPIVDTTLVTVLRRLNGRKVSQGGRDHTSHRLVALGMSERAAAFTLWLLAAASGLVAVLARNLPGAVALLIVPAFLLVLVLFTVFVAHARVYEPIADEREVHGRAVLPTLADFTYKRRIFEVLGDVVVIVLAYYAAFLLRFDGVMELKFYRQFVTSLPLVLVIQLSAFLVLGLYEGLWRYTSMADLSRQMRAVAGGWIASTLAIAFIFHLQGYSRSVLITDGVLLLLGVCGGRVSFRLLRSWVDRSGGAPLGKRVLIYGAGDGGELLVREMQRNHGLGLQAIGFVDDDPQKQGRVIHGVRVLGPLERLSDLAGTERIDEVVVSTSKLAVDRSVMLQDFCKTKGLRYRRMRIALE